MPVTPRFFLNEIAKIEARIGEFYEKLSVRFAGDDELRELFERLADEEHSHKSAFLMLERVLRGFDGDVRIAERFSELYGGMNADLDRAMRFLDEGRPLSAQDALGNSIKLESTLIESHGCSMLVTESPDLKKTLSMMHRESEAHRQRLTDFAKLRREDDGR